MFFHVFRGTLCKVRKKCEKTAFFELFARRPTKSVRTLYKVCKKCEKQRCFLRRHVFHVFRGTLYKVRKKLRKNSVFLSFLHDVIQKVWKSVRQNTKKRHVFFWAFFETLCTKFAKNAEKTCFFFEKNKVFFFETLFARKTVPQKKVRKQCFFHVFRDTFVQSSQKMRKTLRAFLSFLHDKVNIKSVRKQKTVFSRFSRHFVQSSHKMRKTAFFELFARRPTKSEKTVRKQCFFETSHFDTKFAKKKFEKQRFWAFCTTSHKKCFLRHFVQSLQKMFFELFARFSRQCLYKVRKKCEKHGFLSFLQDVPQEVWEILVFFHFFQDILYKVRKKMRKNSVFWAFCTTSHLKSMRKQCFFETLCTKFAKNSKKQRFLSFLHDVPQKVWENSVFFTFFEALCSQKLRKFAKIKSANKVQKMRKTFFELFARRPTKSVRRQSL